jgi:fucose permease
VAIFFAVAAVWSVVLEASPTASAKERAAAVSQRSVGKGPGVPWALLVLIFGATGVDAAAGGWLTSYAQRAGDSLGITIGAATFLWLGSLVSRIVHSTKWASELPERIVLGSSLVAMTAALALLIAWPAGVVTMVAAALLGLAAGPVYPLVIAAALRHRENSTVFAVAGVGASILPLLTGALSSWTHSLRAGLGVPLLAAAVMALVVSVSGAALQEKREAVAEALIG